MKIRFNLNGKEVEFDSLPEMRLIDLLKTSAKVQSLRTSCYRGICRGCAVFFNGDLTASCLIPAFQARDSKIITFEGLNKSDEIHDVLQGFKEAQYYPCDFCRPGKIMTIHSILENYVQPEDHHILEAFSGINCSCTDKSTLLKSVKSASYYRRRRRRERNN